MTIFHNRGPLKMHRERWPGLDEHPLRFAGLATTLGQEHDYFAEIEGELPRDLRGSLYRNGPGRFDRNGRRKRMLLDGDGMVQAFDFEDGADGNARVRYRNRFTRTEKFVAEEAADRFLYATWSTLAPGGMFRNFGARAMRNQAGVSVRRRGDALFAFDEGVPPYEIDAHSLETRGLAESFRDLPATTNTAGAPNPGNSFAAHGKIDGKSGEWLHFGMVYGKENFIQVTIFDANHKLLVKRFLPLDAMYYLHDWLVTEHHLVFVLHPAVVPPSRLMRFLGGNIAFTDAITWQAERGNRVLVVDRECREVPRVFEAPAAWCWHTLNAYETASGEIIADFVGSDQPAGLGTGDDSPLFALMRGEFAPEDDDAFHGRLRRYVIPAGRTGSLRCETLAGDDDYEFPMVRPEEVCHRHRDAYLASRGSADAFWSRIVRLNTENGATDFYDFGPGRYCGEPVFAPGGEHGYLLSLVYDGDTKRSLLAILDAGNVGAGPRACVHLRHHSPLSFHGDWFAGR